MSPFTVIILNKVKELCIFPLQADCIFTPLTMTIEVKLD